MTVRKTNKARVPGTPHPSLITATVEECDGQGEAVVHLRLPLVRTGGWAILLGRQDPRLIDETYAYRVVHVTYDVAGTTISGGVELDGSECTEIWDDREAPEHAVPLAGWKGCSSTREALSDREREVVEEAIEEWLEEHPDGQPSSCWTPVVVGGGER